VSGSTSVGSRPLNAGNNASIYSDPWRGGWLTETGFRQMTIGHAWLITR
jgi:hypothetical protein